MRLSDLRDKEVRSLDGEALGRVHDVHCKQGKIVALTCGAGSLIERWTGKGGGHRIPWDCVVKVDTDAIIINSDARQQKSNAGRS